MKNWKKYFLARLLLIAVVFLSAFGVSLFVADAATDVNSTGSFLLNATPSVSDVDFVDNAYSLTSTLTPDDSTVFGVNFTVDHTAGITDILNVTIYIYDDSDHGSDYNSVATDGSTLIMGSWIESTDTWSISQGSYTMWTEQSSVDPGIASAETQFEFCFRFDISKAALYDTDWNCSVHVFDDDGTPEEDYAAEDGLVTMAQNFEITVSSGTFDWGTVVPASDNNTHGALTVGIYANSAWELRISAADFTASAESDVDVEANDIICLDRDGTPGGGESQWIRNTVAIVTGWTGVDGWDEQSAMSSEAEMSRNVYILLTTGSFFNDGVGKTWSVVVTIYVQANT